MPAVGGAGDGGGQDAGGALFQAAGELSCGLMRLEYPDPWQLDVLAVGQNLDLAGGKPAGVSGPTLLLGSWKAHLMALAAAMPRVREVLEGRA
jgi:hypothetical protein